MRLLNRLRSRVRISRGRGKQYQVVVAQYDLDSGARRVQEERAGLRREW